MPRNVAYGRLRKMMMPRLSTITDPKWTRSRTSARL